jgi:gamma-glutamyltranspeptidase / glutathione hydrolase
MVPAVAAGHEATARAGAEILASGGNAFDAAVAACLASCVAETVMTGIAGGGHAMCWDADRGEAELLDFFVTVPGLGTERREAELVRLEVPFGTELVHYAVGIASCAVPGVPGGLEALHRRCRLPFAELVQPALRVARSGVPMPPAHVACLRMLEPVMTMDAGARIYAPGGTLLDVGDVLHQPGLARMLELTADEGPRTFYEGTLAQELLALMDERGGLVTADDLSSYNALTLAPARLGYAGRTVFTRDGLNSIVAPLARLPALRGLAAPERAAALALALDGAAGEGHTTSLAAVDSDRNACVVTTSLGLGSGDFLPGLDVHLNSMLGESELLTGPLEPGERMASMIAPTIVVDDDGLELAAGSAGGSRLRSALVQVLAGVLDEGVAVTDAIERPRLHPALGTVHLEPGFDAAVEDRLRSEGYTVRSWAAQHHYFGGVSAVGRAGASGDPRRSGYAVVVAP